MSVHGKEARSSQGSAETQDIKSRRFGGEEKRLQSDLVSVFFWLVLEK